MWSSVKRKKLRSAPLPAAWRGIIDACCPFYRRLPTADGVELDGLVQIFLAEKQFEGCGGLVMTDEIRVCVAAHACLLLLHRETDFYPRLRSVLVYPNVYTAPSIRHVGAPELGHNVAWHEFAHQLDFEDGAADGVPVLGRGKSILERQQRYAAWARVMRAEFAQHQARVQRGEPTVLRDYGATNAAEFFAVATECFFGRPIPLQREHSELYDEIKWYYQQDPAGWKWD